jgi:hypothetical protein
VHFLFIASVSKVAGSTLRFPHTATLVRWTPLVATKASPEVTVDDRTHSLVWMLSNEEAIEKVAVAVLYVLTLQSEGIRTYRDIWPFVMWVTQGSMRVGTFRIGVDNVERKLVLDAKLEVVLEVKYKLVFDI